MKPPCCLPLRVPMCRCAESERRTFQVPTLLCSVGLPSKPSNAGRRADQHGFEACCLHNAAGVSGSICNAGHCCVSSALIRKRAIVTRESSCSSHTVQLSAHQDMHSLTTPYINASQSTRLALDLMLRNALTPAYSKSLGPSPAVRRPQPGRSRSLCRLFHPLPHPQSQAAEVCHPVRLRLSVSYTLSITSISLITIP